MLLLDMPCKDEALHQEWAQVADVLAGITASYAPCVSTIKQLGHQ